jgi:hypothetical protein
MTTVRIKHRGDENTCDILVGYVVVDGLFVIHFRGLRLNSAGLTQSTEACLCECYKVTSNYIMATVYKSRYLEATSTFQAPEG